MMLSANYRGAVKTVPVTAYTRFRFGKLEWVCAHFRSWPRG
jgi:hypothetical protein